MQDYSQFDTTQICFFSILILDCVYFGFISFFSLVVTNDIYLLRLFTLVRNLVFFSVFFNFSKYTYWFFIIVIEYFRIGSFKIAFIQHAPTEIKRKLFHLHELNISNGFELFSWIIWWDEPKMNYYVAK